MNSANLTFHHLGLAVRKPEPALDFLRFLGYEVGPCVHDDLQRVNLIMCQSSSMPAVEVIFPGAEKGPLESVLKNTDAQMYHLCFETDNLQAVLDEWSRSGQAPRCVSPRKPAVLFDGRYVSFYYQLGFGLVEILER
jgi:methylmalonyl-CoA/ethylmalonyl-CoA epimerase